MVSRALIIFSINSNDRIGKYWVVLGLFEHSISSLHLDK